MITQLDTTNWVSYPFEVNGIKFVSLLDPQGSFYPRIKTWPAGVFDIENAKMVNELIGDPSKLTTNQLQDELDRINTHASEALIVLA
jgi:hypothetical protein